MANGSYDDNLPTMSKKIRHLGSIVRASLTLLPRWNGKMSSYRNHAPQFKSGRIKSTGEKDVVNDSEKGWFTSKNNFFIFAIYIVIKIFTIPAVID